MRLIRKIAVTIALTVAAAVAVLSVIKSNASMPAEDAPVSAVYTVSGEMYTE